MNIVLIFLVLACVTIFFGLWVAFFKGHRYLIYASVVVFMTVLATGFLYTYDSRLGYGVVAELPQKFRFLYYNKSHDVHYVWVIPQGEKEPRVYIVDPKKFKDFEKQFSRANQNVREGQAVEGERKSGQSQGDTNTHDTIRLNNIDPGKALPK